MPRIAKKNLTENIQQTSETINTEIVESSSVTITPSVKSDVIVESKVKDVIEPSTSKTKTKDILTMINTKNKEMNLLQAELNSLNKQLGRSLKNKLKDRSDQREPSGFAKPAKIKSQLANFLGLESGTLLARTEVTKHITAYIKKHSLNFPEDKRIILPDAKLKALLKVGKGEQLTYFNLQHYLAPHFEQQ